MTKAVVRSCSCGGILHGNQEGSTPLSPETKVDANIYRESAPTIGHTLCGVPLGKPQTRNPEIL